MRAALDRVQRRTRPRPVCSAGDVNLYLYPNGEVRPCCRSSAPLGVVGDQVLSDIWRGDERAALVSALGRGELSGGCAACGDEVAIEGRDASYPATFDPLVDQRPPGSWPRRIEFNLSNRCNLQCVQCNGELSSAIRIHRERRPALASPYADPFFDDLRHFVPHLDLAQFAGGEPFLAPEAYRVWDIVQELKPDLPVTVVTNATQWNDRVADVTARLRMGFVFSLDAIDPDVYEAVRVGASHAQVMQNVDRLTALARAKGTEVSINFCLMTRTLDQLGPMLLEADRRDLWVDVSVVREPPAMSIQSLEPDDLRTAHSRLLAESDIVRPRLGRNRATWDRELARIGRWAEAAGTSRTTVHIESWRARREPLIGVLPLRGRGPVDGDDVRAELAALGAPVHEFTTNAHNVVTAVSPSLLEVLDVASDVIVGRSGDLLTARAVEVLGLPGEPVVVFRNDDRQDIELDFPAHRVRQSTIALRGADGVAERLRTLVVLTPRSPSGADPSGGRSAPNAHP